MQERRVSLWLAVFAALLSLSPWSTLVSASDSVASWTVYHSWDGGNTYSQRGLLEWKGDEEGLVLTNDESAMTKAQVKEMLDFGWYQVKIDTSAEDYVLATVPACNLRRANFRDEFALTLPRISQNDHQITSLAYTPLVSPLAPHDCAELPELNEDKPISWSSKVHADLDVPGMALRTVLPQTKPFPGLTWMTHPNARKGSASKAPGGDPTAGPDSEEAPQKPFFIRYWYVLLPLALANFLPDPQKQQEGQQGGEAAAPAAAAPAPAAGGSKRRGKRN